jgi:hypothetical protein
MVFSGALFCGCSAPRQARRSTDTTVQLNATKRAEVAEKFAQTLADDYCHADLGAKMAAAIRAKLNAKAYDAITSPSDFADALQRDAHAVVADRHLEVDFNSEPLQTPMMDRDLPSIENAIPELRILDGNVGYMVVNGMLPGLAARDAIAWPSLFCTIPTRSSSTCESAIVRVSFSLHRRTPTGTLFEVISDGMRVTISSEKSPRDSQTVMLSPDGRFEFVGLAAGSYNILASVRGYSPPPMAPVSFKDKDGRVLTYTPPPPPVSIEHDVDNFVIKLDPDGSAPAKPVAASKPAQR